MRSYKVVLTGGPCGGKTESLKILNKNLISDNFSVVIIPETANALLSLGYMPGKNISYFDFQNILFKIQFIKEYISEKKAIITLCDRGLLDTKIYMTDESFDILLAQNKVKVENIADTYDAALYYRTIAYEYPDIFQKERVYESAFVGIERDKKSLEVWKDKILQMPYSNLDGYENKIMTIYKVLKNYIVTSNFEQNRMLSDYYSQEIIPFLLSGLEQIMKINQVPNEIQVKTRRLIR